MYLQCHSLLRDHYLTATCSHLSRPWNVHDRLASSCVLFCSVFTEGSTHYLRPHFHSHSASSLFMLSCPGMLRVKVFFSLVLMAVNISVHLFADLLWSGSYCVLWITSCFLLLLFALLRLLLSRRNKLTSDLFCTLPFALLLWLSTFVSLKSQLKMYSFFWHFLKRFPIGLLCIVLQRDCVCVWSELLCVYCSLFVFAYLSTCDTFIQQKWNMSGNSTIPS